MPRSEEKDPVANIKRLAKSHPEFGPKQRVAVAFSEARRAGGHVKPKRTHVPGKVRKFHEEG